MLVSMFVRQQAGPTVKSQNRDDLVVLKELVESGKITPVIDGAYPLSETPKAIARVAPGAPAGRSSSRLWDRTPPSVSDDTRPQVPVAARAVA
ncbi:MAG: zinc-binding dehydrogenase [Aeromicrobium sp.]